MSNRIDTTVFVFFLESRRSEIEYWLDANADRTDPDEWRAPKGEDLAWLVMIYEDFNEFWPEYYSDVLEPQLGRCPTSGICITDDGSNADTGHLKFILTELLSRFEGVVEDATAADDHRLWRLDEFSGDSGSTPEFLKVSGRD